MSNQNTPDNRKYGTKSEEEIQDLLRKSYGKTPLLTAIFKLVYINLRRFLSMKTFTTLNASNMNTEKAHTESALSRPAEDENNKNEQR